MLIVCAPGLFPTSKEIRKLQHTQEHGGSATAGDACTSNYNLSVLDSGYQASHMQTRVYQPSYIYIYTYCMLWYTLDCTLMYIATVTATAAHRVVGTRVVPNRGKRATRRAVIKINHCARVPSPVTTYLTEYLKQLFEKSTVRYVRQGN